MPDEIPLKRDPKKIEGESAPMVRGGEVNKKSALFSQNAFKKLT